MRYVTFVHDEYWKGLNLKQVRMNLRLNMSFLPNWHLWHPNSVVVCVL